MNRQQLTEKHSFFSEAIFRLKSTVMIGESFVRNMLSPVQRFKDEGKLSDKPN